MRWVIGALIAAAVLAAWAEAEEGKRRATEIDAADVHQQLEALQAKQDDILTRLDEVMEELRVVKVRCTN